MTKTKDLSNRLLARLLLKYKPLCNIEPKLIIWTNTLKKHLKYLISFLLIFDLTVNHCFIYSQTNPQIHYQVSQIHSRKEFRHIHFKLYVYGRQLITERIFVSLISYLNLRDICSVQIGRILNLQIEQYQRISSKIARYVFLNKKFMASNQYPSLYIA